ncbi:winged-helix domain-containing protein [Natrinema salsiterrestre]|uniref:ArsR family transcriptional regulator n=1 Tax=Natrinema salsiterrestre TaxID=2950540 RepID=A0A9Q4Q527_9EURY|nr:winged-helix domain-containing protein [Natrinema salsiterrestre]MDF9748142.1 ArsR family transcriptional regulator [Natrinema salsiterrestre]
MNGPTTFVWYNLAVGIIVVLELYYLLYFETAATAYRQFVLTTISGLGLAVIGGPITELIAPSQVHLVHGVAALLVIFGLYNPITNDVRTGDWSRVLLNDPSRVRQQTEWMAPMDDEILSVFYDANLVLTPSIIAFNIGFSQKEVNRRLLELEEHGLIERVKRGKYQLTERGEQYLHGRLHTTASKPNDESRIHH